jgi:hypothetical protein
MVGDTIGRPNDTIHLRPKRQTTTGRLLADHHDYCAGNSPHAKLTLHRHALVQKDETSRFEQVFD